MKRLILSLSSFLCLLAVANQGTAQKLYIWCPKDDITKPRIGFLEGQDVDLVLFDGRNIPTNSKVECDGKDVVLSLSTFIRNVYPSCNISVLPESEYYKPSTEGRITLKIGIASYQAGFGSDIAVGIGNVGGKFSYGIFAKGEWHGLVSYYVQIFDNREANHTKISKEISELTSKPNMWGYKTARTCLYSSYNKANQALLSSIEGALME